MMKCPECSVDCTEAARFCSSCGSSLPHECFVLGVDLDGVVADFYGALRPIAAEWLGVNVEELPSEVSYGLKEWGITLQQYQDLHRFAVAQKEIFSTQPTVPGAAAALRRLGYNRDIRVRIITHRLFVKYTHEISVRQTIEWLEEHGIPYWDICFMKSKGEVGADLYIEDSPNNVVALQQLGKDVVIFTNSTNRQVEGLRANSWEEAEQNVLEKLAEWQEARSKRSKTVEQRSSTFLR
jgi:5'(3')-deoxyribonucleotidase